ncbi:hypothetical protein CALCODRAFT_490660 [Calocera cornea HHB12733]|uniref:Uncharacterized protein n=1 Tax=Calocera cornea HHB12733 TaxID=1353952 RepID=A0A165JNJ7_9BASI|nr:hypothetical protein CALCODRAFT_490660 [Calocera cornea HHB12733]
MPRPARCTATGVQAAAPRRLRRAADPERVSCRLTVLLMYVLPLGSISPSVESFWGLPSPPVPREPPRRRRRATKRERPPAPKQDENTRPAPSPATTAVVS